MSSKKTFIVTPVGLSDNEIRVIKSMCWLSSTRPRSYALARPHCQADIYFVDGDSPEAIQSWREAHARRAAPAIFLTNKEGTTTARYVLKKPLLAARTFAILDEITVKELHFTPEMVIDEATVPLQKVAPSLGNAQSRSQSGPPSLVLDSIAKPTRAFALVVDDSPTVRTQIGYSLQMLGIAADFAEDGDEALRAVASRRYDIIFLDVVLPGADGYQICKAMKKDMAVKNTPIVMLTGKSSTFDRIKGSLAGCDTYLTKPVSNEAFREVVVKHLGNLADMGNTMALAGQSAWAPTA